MKKKIQENIIELYLVRQDRENITYLHLPGNVVFYYDNRTLLDLSQDEGDLEVMDAMVLALKEQNSGDIKLVPVSKQTIIHLLDLGRKIKKLYVSSKKKSVELADQKKKEQLRKVNIKFQNSGRRLLDIIERDLAQERRALEHFDPSALTDEYFEELANRQY